MADQQQRDIICPQPPHTHGEYVPRVSLRDHSLTISIAHVDRGWMPSCLFGRPVFTNIVRIAPDQVGESVAIRLTNDQDGLHLIAGNKVVVLLGNEWPLNVRKSAHDQIAKALHKKSSGMSFQLHSTGALIAALAVVYMMFVSVASSGGSAAQPRALPPIPGQNEVTAPAPASAQEQLEQAMQSSSSHLAQKAVDQYGKTMPIKEALSQATKIVLRPTPAGGKGIIVWSDPLCPHCRDLETAVLSKLPESIGLTIIPVSFRDLSRPIVSHIVCGADDAEKAARWKGLMAQQPSGKIDQQCEAGPGIADKNSVLFARSGLTNTPTIMKENGEIYSLPKFTVEGIEGWLK